MIKLELQNLLPRLKVYLDVDVALEHEVVAGKEVAIQPYQRILADQDSGARALQARSALQALVVQKAQDGVSLSGLELWTPALCV